MWNRPVTPPHRRKLVWTSRLTALVWITLIGIEAMSPRDLHPTEKPLREGSNFSSTRAKLRAPCPRAATRAPTRAKAHVPYGSGAAECVPTHAARPSAGKLPSSSLPAASVPVAVVHAIAQPSAAAVRWSSQCSGAASEFASRRLRDLGARWSRAPRRSCRISSTWTSQARNRLSKCGHRRSRPVGAAPDRSHKARQRVRRAVS
jgi:hypothetical protein